MTDEEAKSPDPSEVRPEVVRTARNIAKFLGMGYSTFRRLRSQSEALRAVIRFDERGMAMATREDLLAYVRSRRSAS